MRTERLNVPAERGKVPGITKAGGIAFFCGTVAAEAIFNVIAT